MCVVRFAHIFLALTLPRELQKVPCCKDTFTSTPTPADHGFSLLEFLLALFLASFLAVVVFHFEFSLQQLHDRQLDLSIIQEDNRFLTLFLNAKIQMAGNSDCLTKPPSAKSEFVKGYNSDDALSKLGLSILPGSDLLQLQECVRLHDQIHDWPIEFFVADTFRQNQQHQEINALFFKVGHHPREELITDVNHFQLQFGVTDVSNNNIVSYQAADTVTDWRKVKMVKINYLLSSHNLNQSGVLYVAIQKS